MRLRCARAGAAAIAFVALTSLVPVSFNAPLAEAQDGQRAIAEGQPQSGLKTASVTIETQDGQRHVFSAEIADTAQTRNIGMMFRRSMADDAGMLFLYERPQNASFWMRNTLIPLDIIFVREDGVIRRIHENARPLDETPLPSGGPILSVLEIRGGRASELGLRPGDTVRSIALSPFWRRANSAKGAGQ